VHLQHRIEGLHLCAMILKIYEVREFAIVDSESINADRRVLESLSDAQEATANASTGGAYEKPAKRCHHHPKQPGKRDTPKRTLHSQVIKRSRPSD